MEAVTDWGHLDFGNAIFQGVIEFGPVAAHRLTLDGARFDRHVQFEVTVDWLTFVGTRFDDGMTLHIGYGAIVAERTFFGAPSSIASDFADKRHRMDDKFREKWEQSSLVGPGLVSLRGTDVSNLLVVDIDLRWCLFAGAHRLDQLRFAGDCWFNSLEVPRPMTRRIIIAEEYLLRLDLSGPLSQHPFLPDRTIGLERIMNLYRSLRKALEDSKNEAGAGDFYYGEMQARRHYETNWTELLTLRTYWLLSGYGQRAGRAVAWLGVLAVIVCTLLFVWGLPGEVVWTWARVDQALRIGTGAVVFREAGQTLTSAGSWTVMVARFTGPVLLALAVLAIRARVKR